MRIIITDPFPTAPAEIPAGLTVITPNRGAANLLSSPFESLESIAKKTLTGRGLRVLPKLRSRYYQKKAIKDVLGWNDVDGDAPAGQDASAYLARINEAFTTVLRLGIDDGLLTEKGIGSTEDLGNIILHYRNLLSKIGAVDSEAVLIKASECFPAQQPMLVWGHFRARQEEILFINAAAGEDSIFYLPCGNDPIFETNRDWAEKLEKRGWTLQRTDSSEIAGFGASLATRFTGDQNDVSSAALSFANVEAEVRGILSRCKSLLVSGTPLHQIGIVARKPENYAASFAAAAAEYGIPMQIGRRVPTLRTAFGGFMQLLLDVLENSLPFEETIRLLMHRFGPGMDTGKLAEARKDHFTGIEAWAEAGFDISAFDVPSENSLSGWLAEVERIFGHLGVKQRIASDAVALLAFEEFSKEIRTVGLMETDRKIPLSGFKALCLEALSETKVPFSASKAGIELLGTDALFGAAYDHLFFVGLAEGEFPAHVVDNAAVDFYERERLSNHGIEFEAADEVGRWESLAFYLSLLSARKSVTLSYARIGAKDETPESPFFARLGLQPEPIETKTTACSLPESRKMALANGRIETITEDLLRRYRVELARETSAVYDEYDGIAGIAISAESCEWSVSQFTKFGQCSFKWFADKLLRLKEPKEMELSLDVSTRGTFYHKVLELATNRTLDSEDQRAAILAVLEDAFRAAENDEKVMLPDYTNWDLQADEHLKIIRKSVESNDFIRDGDRIIAAEKRFEATWQGLFIRGTIDRIDDTAEGLVAIDYKTSSAAPKGAKDEDGNLKLDVQIPIYASVALSELYPDKVVGQSKYYSLTKGKNLSASRDNATDGVELLIDRLKQRLAAGAFPVDPDHKNDACKHCEFDSVCRRSHRLERKTWSD